MKCPKCHYLSFEPEPRCRNCGYDLSIAESELAAADADLSIHAAEAPEGPLIDLQLRKPAAAAPPAPITLGPMRSWEASVDVAAAEPAAPAVASIAVAEPEPAVEPPPPPPQPPRRPPVTTTDLPLFVKRMTGRDPDNDEPLVKIPAVPRVPLGVRRSSPEPAKSRPKPAMATQRRLGPFDHPAPEHAPGVERPFEVSAHVAPRVEAPPAVHPAIANAAGPVKRLAAAVLDAVVLAGISSAVVWITLKFCQLTIDQARALPLLPLAPLVAFLLLIDLGYLLMFTAAGGQTLGKMAAHIRVVGVSRTDGSTTQLTPRQAGYRALLTLPSVLALGAGFLPALVRGQAFHDRISHTRVVRA